MKLRIRKLNKSNRKLRRVTSKKGSVNMGDLRSNKLALKELLMKDVKTDEKGRVLISIDDEWRKETEWNEN